jgi:hypothetical protein
VLKPLNEKISALETKLASMPGTVSATEKENPDEGKKLSAKETALAKVESVRAVFTKLKK